MKYLLLNPVFMKYLLLDLSFYGNLPLMCYLFEARGPLRDSTGDRRIGLNKNYSIIFTEISFSPETSILLQIIQIILMTVGIIPESDSKGNAVCQFWLQGGKHNVTPTDKITFRRESPWGLLDPPFFGEGRRSLSFPKESQHKRDSNPARRGRSWDVPRCHHGSCSLQAVSLGADISKVESSSPIL